MKAEKTKNGKWRIRAYSHTDEQGKKHYRSFTADTKAEVNLLYAEFKNDQEPISRRKAQDMTVGEAVDQYIELRKYLSPTTLDGYKRMRKCGFQEIMHCKVSKLDDISMQKAINREAERKTERTNKQISAKTLKEEYSLIASAIKTICKKTFIVELPTKQKHKKKYPDVEEVMKAIKGSDIEVFCLLALCLSFTKSEIRGLMCSDINGNEVSINRVVVDTNEGQISKDDAKTQTRLRTVVAPQFLIDKINELEVMKKYKETSIDTPLWSRDGSKLYRSWRAICKANEFNLTFHDLRHLNTSAMVGLNVPKIFMMERNGWSTPNVMESTYQHALPSTKKAYDNLINSYFEDVYNQKYDNKV